MKGKKKLKLRPHWGWMVLVLFVLLFSIAAVAVIWRFPSRIDDYLEDMDWGRREATFELSKETHRGLGLDHFAPM
jgi:hypothetical protein